MQSLLLFTFLFANVFAAPFRPFKAPRVSHTPGGGVSGKATRAENGTVEADALTKQLLAIAPNTTTCEGAKYPDECRTAAEAAQPILDSFATYALDSTNEQAAVVSLMLYESGEFKYNWGHFVAGETVHTPGKGTRNMQSAAFNGLYARALFGDEKVDAANATGGADGVLELVSPDGPSFGSAAWFLTSQCNSTVREGVQSGTQDGWAIYITDCIGTTVDDGRIDYWTKAKKALGAQ
ncbi:hypothetical protein HDZ31DRAFT_31533 [Schizophyllum fasciatum]